MTPEQALSLIQTSAKNADAFGTTAVMVCMSRDCMTLATAALSKQVPLPPKTEDNDHYCCPTCGQYWGKIRPYCYMCGQKIGVKK